MTIYPVYLRPRVKLRTRRERFELPDGDFVDLDWVDPPTDRPAATVLLLHGLESSIDAGYVRGTLAACRARGWRAVLMHFRNCSEEPNRLRRTYHSGETEDLRTVIGALQDRFRDTPLVGAGFSLGGNVLLKYLGETGVDTPLVGAAVVSVPLMLSPCATQLERGFSRVYGRHLVGLLKAGLRKKRTAVDLGPLDRADDPDIRTIRLYDEHVISPMFGFGGAEDYYARCSSRPFLGRIRIPTLILHAADDPFMTEEVIPDESELSPQVTLELSQKGGHVGFVSGPPWRPSYWFERRIPEFLGERIA